MNNILSDSGNPPTKIGHLHIRNFFFIDDVKGRDSYHRMYERTTFHISRRVNISKP